MFPYLKGFSLFKGFYFNFDVSCFLMKHIYEPPMKEAYEEHVPF